MVRGRSPFFDHAAAKQLYGLGPFSNFSTIEFWISRVVLSVQDALEVLHSLTGAKALRSLLALLSVEWVSRTSRGWLRRNCASVLCLFGGP